MSEASQRASAERRFLSKFTEGPQVPDVEGRCLLWVDKPDRYGYGWLGWAVDSKAIRAHVYAWSRVHGPKPKGLIVHHCCEVKLCVNADHLQLMTRAEHAAEHHRGVPGRKGASAINAAKTQCKRGHEFTEANTRRDVNGQRHCRKCDQMHSAAAHARRKKAA